MRRVLLAILFLGLVGGGIAYFWPRPAAGGLQVTPNPIDFGDVPWLEATKRTIEIRNTSQREILLKDPHFDCSCFSLVRAPDTSHLAPGRSTTLEILLFTPKTAPGRFHKRFTLDSDDPVSPRLDVPILGNIRDYRSVTPREVSFGAVDVTAEPPARVVEVRGGHQYKVAVTAGRSTDPRAAIAVTDATGGSDVTIRTVKGAEKGKLEAQVALTLEVTGPDGSKRSYPELIWVHGELR